MPTTTWRTMRREIMEPLGLVQVSTTTNIDADTSIVSTELQSRFPSDDTFNGQWYATVALDVDGGTPANAGETRRVSDYAASSGTLTVTGPNLASEDEAVDIDLYRHFHPTDILRAYNRARQLVWPQLGIVRDIETVVTGQQQVAYAVPSTMRRINRIQLGRRYEAVNTAENLLLNAGFEEWDDSQIAATETQNSWTLAGSGATANQEQETTTPSNYMVLSGSNSARIVAPVSTATTLLQTFNSASSSYTAVGTEGAECNASAWVYCTTASRVSVRIAGNDGATHGGTGWELIKHSQNLAATATTVAVGIAVSSGAAIPVFVDEVIMTLGPSEGIERPYEPILNWEHTPPVAGASSGGTIRFAAPLPPKRRLRIIGADMLSAVSADTDTVEIDGELLGPLYNKVRQIMCDERAMGDPNSDFYALARRFDAEYLRDIETGLGLRVPPARFKVPDMVY